MVKLMEHTRAGFSRRALLTSVAGASAAVAIGGAAMWGRRAPRRRNLVFIVSDALRADRLGCYGYRPAGASLSPNIDALAARGSLFERCIAPSSWTPQSVAAYMASRPPFVEGAAYNEGFAPKQATTLAEALRAAGYGTAALVKNPWLWAVSPDGSRDIVAARGFQSYHTGHMTQVRNPLFAQGIGEEQVYDRFSDAAAAVRQVGILLPALKSTGPFLIYVHFMDTHEPYNPPDRYKGACKVPAVPGIPDYMLHQVMRAHAKARGEEKLVESDMPLFERASGLYDACVRFVDDEVGNLMALLKAQGVFDDTTVILSSDHGEEFLEHGWIGHSTTLYEESLRVPLIVAGQDARPGVRIERAASSLDIAPTALAACAVEVPQTMFGSPLDLSGADYSQPRVLASLVRPDGAAPTSEKMYMLSDAGRKLIRHEYFADKSALPPRDELYDLRKDPSEKVDLASGDAAAAALSGHLAQIRDLNRGIVEKGMTIDDETMRRLRSLGYLGG